jgi:hypothetical protein
MMGETPWPTPAYIGRLTLLYTLCALATGVLVCIVLLMIYSPMITLISAISFFIGVYRKAIMEPILGMLRSACRIFHHHRSIDYVDHA